MGRASISKDVRTGAQITSVIVVIVDPQQTNPVT